MGFERAANPAHERIRACIARLRQICESIGTGVVADGFVREVSRHLEAIGQASDEMERGRGIALSESQITMIIRKLEDDKDRNDAFIRYYAGKDGLSANGNVRELLISSRLISDELEAAILTLKAQRDTPKKKHP